MSSQPSSVSGNACASVGAAAGATGLGPVGTIAPGARGSGTASGRGGNTGAPATGGRLRVRVGGGVPAHGAALDEGTTGGRSGEALATDGGADIVGMAFGTGAEVAPRGRPSAGAGGNTGPDDGRGAPDGSEPNSAAPAGGAGTRITSGRAGGTERGSDDATAGLA